MTPSDLDGPKPDFASIDVSFISLKIILPPLIELLQRPADIAVLIKPQFEAGREKVGKSGVVRDSKVHLEVLETVLGFAVDIGYMLKGLTFSPITGGEGNIEFLAHLGLEANEETDQIPIEEKAAANMVEIQKMARQVVDEASNTFHANPSK
ncbi:16S/23S rRNA (cytidine-2'-O)-methyltransferase TlyA [compost metagenome]